MSAQRGLGKGLGALLGESAMQPAPEGGALMLALQKVEPNPDQPRRLPMPSGSTASSSR